MTGAYLKFYVHERRKHHGQLLYEWLLQHAKTLGIHGGSALRAIAGFGRHGVMHEGHFFELQGDLPVEISFVVSDAEADRLLASLATERLELFYVRMAAEFGTLSA